ncbi:MAG: hypothetical protein RML36_03390 [Anaerolineae bacterium]|nr:hypothetical protein [Anaerolineae bacterium]MDW8098513.1 hypothetical protein [Anaerolineae bacterium]
MTIVAVACGPVISANEITPITPLPRTNIASLVQATTSVPVRAIPDQTTTSAPPRSEEIVTVTPTPTPWSLNLPAGNAAAIAAATDVAMRPTPRHRLTFHDNSPVPIKFSEFYDGYDLRTGLILSDKLVSLDGREVVIEGYMAPPLKPELDFFVLTRIRLEFCPFCSTAADWPDDIALVYVLGDPIPVTERPLRLIGRLEVGPSVDQETGMVSLVRIYARTVEVLN